MAAVSSTAIPNGCPFAGLDGGSVGTKTRETYTRAEVATHKRSHDLWIIIHGKVYDVTKWAAKHPGGTRIIRHYGGEDASVRV